MTEANILYTKCGELDLKRLVGSWVINGGMGLVKSVASSGTSDLEGVELNRAICYQPPVAHVTAAALSLSLHQVVWYSTHQ